MIVVTVARRPLSEGSVAGNVLVQGTGALNIGACRIETTDDLNGGAYSAEASARHDGDENWRYKRGNEGGLAGKEFTQPPGRWPANLVLEHLAGCVPAGTMFVKADRHYPALEKTSPGGSGLTMGGGWTGEKGPERRTREEQVPAWRCADGCPVADLDRQQPVTGGRAPVTRQGLVRDPNVYGAFHAVGDDGASFYGDAGGAARFFKQVGRPL